MIFIAAGVLAGVALGAAITGYFVRKSRLPAPSPRVTDELVSSVAGGPSTQKNDWINPPHAYLSGEPPEQQQAVIEADEPFRVVSLDYLTGSGRAVAHQDLSLEGKRIFYPIEDHFIRGVLRIESNPWDGSGMVQLRFYVRRGDLEKAILLSLSVVPEIKLGPAGRMEEFRRLVDPRSVPSSMHSTMVQ